MTMHEWAKFLSEPLVLVALCAIGGGTMLAVVAWAFTGEYEKGGYESVHRRPADKDAKPWNLDTDGQPIVHTPRHKFEGTPDEGTRRLWPTTNSARSRVVMIGPEGIIEDGNRRPAREVAEGEGEGGEEGVEEAHEEVPSVANSQARWFRNAVTGEYIFVDEFGRRVEWQA